MRAANTTTTLLFSVLALIYIYKNSRICCAVSADGEWPSPSCQYPDWFRRRTWQSLNGQVQFSVDRGGTALHRKRSITSETGSISGSEYRCLRRSEGGTRFERRDSATIPLSAFVLHDWSVVGLHYRSRALRQAHCAVLVRARNLLSTTRLHTYMS